MRPSPTLIQSWKDLPILLYPLSILCVLFYMGYHSIGDLPLLFEQFGPYGVSHEQSEKSTYGEFSFSVMPTVGDEWARFSVSPTVLVQERPCSTLQTDVTLFCPTLSSILKDITMQRAEPQRNRFTRTGPP